MGEPGKRWQPGPKRIDAVSPETPVHVQWEGGGDRMHFSADPNPSVHFPRQGLGQFQGELLHREHTQERRVKVKKRQDMSVDHTTCSTAELKPWANGQDRLPPDDPVCGGEVLPQAQAWPLRHCKFPARSQAAA